MVRAALAQEEATQLAREEDLEVTIPAELSREEAAQKAEFPAHMVLAERAQEETAQKDKFLALTIRAETTQKEATQLAREEDLEVTAPPEMARKKRRSA